MKDYTEIIAAALEAVPISAILKNDVNKEIFSAINDDAISNQIHWFPPFLAVDRTNFYLFIPFPFDPFLGVDEAKKECDTAYVLSNSLKSKGYIPKIFIIIDSIDQLQFIQLLGLSDDFGILHDDSVNPVLEFTIPIPSDAPRRILPYVLEYLSHPKNLKGPIANVLKKFANNYLKSMPTGDKEHEMIRKFVDALLKCDSRFKLPQTLMTFMEKIERALPEKKLRDHYFHACNTLLLGYVVIDRFYKRFSSTSKTYGSDIIPEFIWAITALYHDIGYPASLLDELVNQAYLVNVEDGLSCGLLKDARQRLWDKKFISIAQIIDDLYNHISNTDGEKWVLDGFAITHKATNFLNALKECFIEKGAHGAHGSLLIVSLINKVIYDINNKGDRQYFYRHMAIAAISVLFHDASVRNILRQSKINSIPIAKFPFSGLLTYIDILQDDRRDFASTIATPDIFKCIEGSEGIIEARLNSTALNNTVKFKLFSELKEAFTFYIVNGLNFKIPSELA